MYLVPRPLPPVVITTSVFLTLSNVPVYVATDISGNVYVSTSDDNSVTKYNSDGEIQWTVSDYDGGLSSFILPSGIAVDSSGNVYVADSGNDQIAKISSNATSVTVYSTGNTLGPVPFDNPTALALDSTENLYVADTGSNQIAIIPFDATPGGDNASYFSTSYDGGGEFSSLQGIAVDSIGNVYVADTVNNQIAIIPFGAEVGGANAEVYSTGYSDSSNFNLPTGLATNSNGDVYVSNLGSNQIAKILSGASAGDNAEVYSTGYSDPISSFSNPRGIATNSNGDVYVVDSGTNKIAIITSSGGPGGGGGGPM
jgi:sugar lactone lactonase YvrE